MQDRVQNGAPARLAAADVLQQVSRAQKSAWGCRALAEAVQISSPRSNSLLKSHWGVKASRWTRPSILPFSDDFDGQNFPLYIVIFTPLRHDEG